MVITERENRRVLSFGGGGEKLSLSRSTFELGLGVQESNAFESVRHNNFCAPLPLVIRV